MNLFEIDFLAKLTTLLKEAFKFKKYKAMSPVLAVFTGLLMLPIVVASFSVAASFAVLGFVFSVISAPVKYLHEIVRVEGKEVKHATQFIVYFLSWPTVFGLYVVMSFLLVLLLPTYALLSFLLYVWSLGGFKFHLLLNKVDDISIEVNGTYKLLPIVFVIIGGMVVFLIPLVHGIVYYVDLYQDFMERLFAPTFFGGIYLVYLSLHNAFATLYSLIGFARHPKETK
ncbi:MAG: hypothetical protein J6B71_04730 [Clostridia bacterium]|nr:hypothetical protein [Clostridia bacterium]